MHCHTKYPQPCSRPLLTHASAADSWTLTGKSGSVSCGVSAPFFWILVHSKFCLCPKSLFPQPCVSSVIKSHLHPKSNSLGVLSPFARSPGWVILEVTNRFKRLDLIDRVPEELWTEVHDILQEAGTKTIPKKKKGKMVV